MDVYVEHSTARNLVSVLCMLVPTYGPGTNEVWICPLGSIHSSRVCELNPPQRPRAPLLHECIIDELLVLSIPPRFTRGYGPWRRATPEYTFQSQSLALYISRGFLLRNLSMPCIATCQHRMGWNILLYLVPGSPGPNFRLSQISVKVLADLSDGVACISFVPQSILTKVRDDLISRYSCGHPESSSINDFFLSGFFASKIL